MKAWHTLKRQTWLRPHHCGIVATAPKILHCIAATYYGIPPFPFPIPQKTFSDLSSYLHRQLISLHLSILYSLRTFTFLLPQSSSRSYNNHCLTRPRIRTPVLAWITLESRQSPVYEIVSMRMRTWLMPDHPTSHGRRSTGRCGSPSTRGCERVRICMRSNKRPCELPSVSLSRTSKQSCISHHHHAKRAMANELHRIAAC